MDVMFRFLLDSFSENVVEDLEVSMAWQVPLGRMRLWEDSTGVDNMSRWASSQLNP